jgi:hypothetical protein
LETEPDVPADENVPVDVPILSIPPAVVTPIVHWDINDLHDLLGHANFEAIEKSEKYYNKLVCEPKYVPHVHLPKFIRKT